MVIDLTKFVGRFAEEAREHLKTINNSLVVFEKDTENQELMNVIFRSLHTIKGSSKILNLLPIADLTHKVEDIFDALRSQKIHSSSPLIDLILKAIDAISDMVDMAADGAEIPAAESELIERLEDVLEGDFSQKATESASDRAIVENTAENIKAASSIDILPNKEHLSVNLPDNRQQVDIETPDNWFTSLSQFEQTSILSFIAEARESIAKICNGLISLEKEHDSEVLNSIFRSAHGIKGSAQMLNLKSLSDFAHRIEDILDSLRNNKISPSSELYNLLLESTDTLQHLLDLLEQGHKIKPVRGGIVSRLDAVIKGKSIFEKVENEEDQTLSTLPTQTAPLPTKKEETRPEKAKSAAYPEKVTPFKKGESIRVSTDRLDGLIKLMGEIVSIQNRLKYSMFGIQKIEKQASVICDRLTNFFSEEEEAGLAQSTLVQPFQELFQKINSISSPIRDDINIQELLTHELQDKALKMRMLPLSSIFNTLPRTIRDLSHSLDKKVEFTIEGGETELDKKMIEKLGDPLIHMLRNAIDHGIEFPEIRLAKNKHATGTVNLSAYYEGGSVVIKLQDDGAGMSKDTLKTKALEKNLFDEDTLNKMPDKDIYELIFHPGFSTTTSVTDISGRGVGMDVVKRNIVTDLKGSIEIESVHGQGTAFCIRLPLTLSIMNVLLVESAKMIFALSSNFVAEVLRVRNADLIDVMNRKAIRLREHLIPVVELGSILHVPGNDFSGSNSEMTLIIILHMGEERLGVIVNSLISEDDMVIKPLPNHMKNNEWVTGIAITGKNELVNVLHIPMLFSSAKKSVGYTEKPPQTTFSKGPAKILVVDDSFNTREIEKSILESSGYIVDTAQDGEEGLTMAQKSQFDLIVTDCEMPKMNGFELIEQLRKNEYYRERPIIIVTSKDREEDKLKGMNVGADAYIIKGAFDQNTLLDTVESLIG